MTRTSTRLGWWATATCTLLLAAIRASGAAQEPATPEPQKTPEEIRAEETFNRVCIKCHTADRVVGSRRSRSQWEETIVTMQTARGAVISDEEFETVLNYLVKEHGRVNVNRGTVDDIVEVLGVPNAAADAIVKYRKDHGPFEDFDGLAKVPGLDLAKLEKKRDAMTF